MKKYILFFIVLVPVFSFTQTFDMIHHQPLNLEESTNLILMVNQGASSIQNIYLFSKPLNNVDFVEQEIDVSSMSGEQFIIPVENTDTQKLAYYFKLILTDGTIHTLPATTPELNPYVLQKVGNKKENKFVKLSPENGTFFINEEILFSISFFTMSDDIDKSTIQFFVNGKDVTSQSTLTDNLILYKKEFHEGGKVNYFMTAKSKSGEIYKSQLWVTSIHRMKLLELPFDYYGSISSISGIDIDSGSDSSFVQDDTDKYSKAKIDLTLKKNWFKFNTNLLISSYNDSNKQPVNNYRFTFDVPHFKLILGDFTSQMGQFVFRNNKINGVFSNLHFEYFRLKTAFGKNVFARDSSQELSFKRNSFAIRSELGSKKIFNINMTIAKNKDDLESIQNPERIDAKDNIVASTDFMWNIWKNKLTLGAETAVSLYNSKINDGVMAQEDLENYGIDDMVSEDDLETLQDIFVVNKYMEPFGVSRANIAYKTYLKFYFKRNLLNFSYSEIGPSFNSLSANSIQKDSRIISIYDAISVWNNQIHLATGMNFNSDNIIDTKETTTTSNNIFTNASLRIRDLPIFGFSYTSSNTANNVSDNSLLYIDQKTGIYNLNIGYKVNQISYAPTNFSFVVSSFNSQQIRNILDVDNVVGSDETDSENLSISLSAKSNFRDFPLQTCVSFINQQQSDDDKTTTFNIKTNYDLLDENLTPYVGFKISNYDIGGDKSSRSLFSFGTGYKFFRDTYLSSNFYLRNYINEDQSDFNYSNISWDIKIRYRF